MPEEPWQNSRRVWHVHTDGITAGTIVPSTGVTSASNSTLLLRLDNGQRMMEVDEYETESVSEQGTGVYLIEILRLYFRFFSRRKSREKVIIFK